MAKRRKKYSREFRDSAVKLMFDIREHYLRFKVLEAKVQSPGFDRSQASAVARKLEKLLEEAPGLDQRFQELNRGFLYESELKSENANRNKKWNCSTSGLRERDSPLRR